MEKNDRLVAGGSTVHDLGMNRQSDQSSSDFVAVDDPDEHPTNISCRVYSESQRNISDAIEALKRGEELWMKHLDASAARKEKHIVIEERCLALEHEAGTTDRSTPLLCIIIEEKWVTIDDKRA